MFENEYKLKSFLLLTYHKTRVVIYGYGPWYGHMMDWRGMNIFHGRLPNSPVFANVAEAEKWLRRKVADRTYYDGRRLSGHHAGEHECCKGCDDREIKSIYFRELKKG